MGGMALTLGREAQGVGRGSRGVKAALGKGRGGKMAVPIGLQLLQRGGTFSRARAQRMEGGGRKPDGPLFLTLTLGATFPHLEA